MKKLTKDFVEKLSSEGCIILENEPLSKHTSFHIGGAAKFLIEISTDEALSVFLKEAGKKKIKFFVLGGGTNVLFSDKGFDGVVIKLKGDFEKREFKGNEVSCGAAEMLPALVKAAAARNLSGLECAAGIPGTVGGAVSGNVGSADKWISSAVESVEVYKNAKKTLINKAKIGFGYRKSGLEGCVITKVNFSLKKEAGNDILKQISTAMEKRIKTQSVGGANAGCIFKNPAGLSAGKIIDEAGLKGKKSGGAKISEMHANFIVNTGNAKAKDVMSLIDLVKNVILEKNGIELETEIKIIK